MLGEDYDHKNMMKQKKRLQIPADLKRVESDFTTNNETFFTKHLDFASFSIQDFKVSGDEFPPEEIISLVINNAKRMGEKLEGTVPSSCVLSTPAHWMSYKRKSFLVAAETSGYKASLINCTTSSAIAYMSEVRSRSVASFSLSSSNLSPTIFAVLPNQGGRKGRRQGQEKRAAHLHRRGLRRGRLLRYRHH